jgi:curli production assembly/transport component CsgF
MTSRSIRSVLCRAGIAAVLTAGGAQATELVYTPVNPVFGGNPLNGQVLLNNAQAQNNKKDPDAALGSQRSPLQQFNETLQRVILSSLASTVAGKFVTQDGQIVPGSFKSGNFEINIVALPGDLLQITTSDTTTGQTTVFTLDQPAAPAAP